MYMTLTLKEKGLVHVMCDTYACCPLIQDTHIHVDTLFADIC